MTKQLCLLAVVFAAAGCPELTDPLTPAEPPETALRGIYSVDAWTQNISGCDEDGDPNPLFREGVLFGIHPDAQVGEERGWLHAYVCTDTENCVSKQDKGGLAGLDPYGWQLFDGSDAAGWSSITDAATTTDDGMCRGVREVTTLTATGTSVRVEVENIRVDEFAQVDGDDPCPDELVVDNLGACYKFESLDATFLEAFPDP
ncbi:MAG: hypothetical protein AB8H79_01645 [Myxococcota bacterium]